MAQKRRKAMALRDTSNECGLLVKAMRQLTQSVNVVVSVSAGGKEHARREVDGGPSAQRQGEERNDE